MTLFRIATVNYSSWTSWHCISSCNDSTKRKDASLPGAARPSFVSCHVVPIAAWQACAVQQQWAASKLLLFLLLHECMNQLQVSHAWGPQYGTSVCALWSVSWPLTIWALSLKLWPLWEVYPSYGRGSIPILSSSIIYFPSILDRQRRSWYFACTSSGSTRVCLKPRIKNGLLLFEFLASRVH